MAKKYTIGSPMKPVRGVAFAPFGIMARVVNAHGDSWLDVRAGGVIKNRDIHRRVVIRDLTEDESRTARIAELEAEIERMKSTLRKVRCWAKAARADSFKEIQRIASREIDRSAERAGR